MVVLFQGQAQFEKPLLACLICYLLYIGIYVVLYAFPAHVRPLSLLSVWSVKVQRSNRTLPWESGTNNNSNFLPYQHYNTYHPDQSRSQTKQKTSPNNPRNVPSLLLHPYPLVSSSSLISNKCIPLFYGFWLYNLYFQIDFHFYCLIKTQGLIFSKRFG